jgi:hypothetical protein
MSNSQYAVPQSGPSKGTAVILELLPALPFGLFGIGWMYAGKTSTGVILLICGILFIWGGYITIVLGATVFTALTAGLGFLVYCCVCAVPLVQFVGAILSTLMLSSTLR